MYSYHLFKTNKNFYVYDSNSNKIFLLNKKTFTKLLNGEDAPFSIQEKGFLIKKGTRKYVDFNKDNLSNQIKNNLNQLTIEVTEKCNFRCVYCPYSENSNIFTKRNNKSISLSSAKKAISYYLKNSSDVNNKFIGFYGGEPLIEIKKIAKLVEYAKECNKLKYDLQFGITTNGSLLNDNVIDFLNKNNFNITLSLDGYEEIHNKFRKCKSKTNSHGKILAKLDKIKKSYGENIFKKLIFNCVISYHTDLYELDRFYQNLEYINTHNQLKISMVNYSGLTAEVIDYLSIQNFKSRFDIQLQKFKSNYYNKITNDKIGEATYLERALFEKNFVPLFRREVENRQVQIESAIPVSGICVPLQKKLFVDSNGDFHICEKLNYFKTFGNIEIGIDFEKLYGFLNLYYKKVVNEFCINCWQKRLCTNCYLNAIDVYKNKIDLIKLKQNCDHTKANSNQILIDYMEILEKKSGAFDFLDNYVIV